LAVGKGSGTLAVNGNLTFKGGAGPNTLDLNLYGGGKIGGVLDFEGGSGNDQFSSTSMGLSVKMLKLNLGDGINSVSLELFGGKIGDITETGGSGDDTADITGLNAVLGRVTFNLGDGANIANMALLGGSAKAITYTGGAGTDGLNFTGYGSTKIAGGVLVDDGAGPANNTVLLDGNCTVSGPLQFTSGSHPGGNVSTAVSVIASKIGGLIDTMGDGPSTLSFGASPYVSTNATIAGLVKITGGTGDDSVDLSSTNLSATKGIFIDLGDGTNHVTGSFLNLNSKALSIIGGAGDDTINVSGTGKLGAATLHLGAGNNAATLTDGPGSLQVGSLDFLSESAAGSTDSLTLTGVHFAGKFTGIFGAGASTVQIDDSVFSGIVTLNTGAGADVVNLDTTDSGSATFFTKAVSIDLGAGADAIALGGTLSTERIVTSSTFTVNGGIDFDTDTKTDGGHNTFAKPVAYTNFP
jgi:hypothetical protein